MKIQEIRKLKNISRYRLSKMSGIRESTLQSIENSDNPNPTFKTMCKIADALEITLDELRSETNESIESDFSQRTTRN